MKHWSDSVFSSEFVLVAFVVVMVFFITLRLAQGFAEDRTYKREISRLGEKKKDAAKQDGPASLKSRNSEAKETRKKRKNAARRDSSSDGWTGLYCC